MKPKISVSSHLSHMHELRIFLCCAVFQNPWTWSQWLMRRPKTQYDNKIVKTTNNRYSPYARRKTTWSQVIRCRLRRNIAFVLFKMKWKNSPTQELLLNAMQPQRDALWFDYWKFFKLFLLFCFRVHSHRTAMDLDDVVKLASLRSQFMRAQNSDLIRNGRQTSTYSWHSMATSKNITQWNFEGNFFRMLIAAIRYLFTELSLHDSVFISIWGNELCVDVGEYPFVDHLFLIYDFLIRMNTMCWNHKDARHVIIQTQNNGCKILFNFIRLITSLF